MGNTCGGSTCCGNDADIHPDRKDLNSSNPVSNLQGFPTAVKGTGKVGTVGTVNGDFLPGSLEIDDDRYNNPNVNVRNRT